MRFVYLARHSRALVIGAVLLVVGTPVALLAGAILSARRVMQESSCNCQMCGYSSGLGSYYSVRHAFPPEYADENQGRRLWPEIMGQMLGLGEDVNLLCPSGAARFVAIGGPGAILDGSEPVEADAVSDGCDDTLLLVELTLAELANAEGPTIRPDAIDNLADAEGLFPPSSIHPHGRGMVFADCRNYRQLKPIPIRDMQALCTKAGGEGETRQKLVDAGCLVHVGWYPQIP